MINITKQGNNVIVTSDNPNSFNISNGELSVPLNTIYYVLDDESDFIQFNSTEEGNILFNGTIGQIQVNGNIVTRDNILMELDNVFNSAAIAGEGGTAGVLSINGYDGYINLKSINGQSLIGSGDYNIDAEKLYFNGIMQQSNGYLLYNIAKAKGDSIKFKTINGESIVGSGDITVEGGSSAEESDPIFTEWKNADDVIVGNGAKYDTDGASEEEIQPSIIIGKGASVWASGIAIGENATSESGAVTIGKNVSSYGIVSIGSDNEGSGIAIGKNNKGSGIAIGENNSGSGIIIGSGVTEIYGGIAIGDDVINQTEFGIAIGTRAKNNWENVDNNNSIAIGLNAQNNERNSIAFGVGAKTIGRNELAIGNDVETDATYKTNFNNVLKGDTNGFAFVKAADGSFVQLHTEWTGTQSQYDALDIYYDNITYNIIED